VLLFRPARALVTSDLFWNYPRAAPGGTQLWKFGMDQARADAARPRPPRPPARPAPRGRLYGRGQGRAGAGATAPCCLRSAGSPSIRFCRAAAWAAAGRGRAGVRRQSCGPPGRLMLGSARRCTGASTSAS